MNEGFNYSDKLSNRQIHDLILNNYPFLTTGSERMSSQHVIVDGDCEDLGLTVRREQQDLELLGLAPEQVQQSAHGAIAYIDAGVPQWYTSGRYYFIRFDPNHMGGVVVWSNNIIYGGGPVDEYRIIEDNRANNAIHIARQSLEFYRDGVIEGVAAGHYRLSASRVAWALGINGQKIIQPAFELDWVHYERYLSFLMNKRVMDSFDIMYLDNTIRYLTDFFPIDPPVRGFKYGRHKNLIDFLKDLSNNLNKKKFAREQYIKKDVRDIKAKLAGRLLGLGAQRELEKMIQSNRYNGEKIRRFLEQKYGECMSLINYEKEGDDSTSQVQQGIEYFLKIFGNPAYQGVIDDVLPQGHYILNPDVSDSLPL